VGETPSDRNTVLAGVAPPPSLLSCHQHEGKSSRTSAPERLLNSEEGDHLWGRGPKRQRSSDVIPELKLYRMRVQVDLILEV
jgi:hypothetical protein